MLLGERAVVNLDVIGVVDRLFAVAVLAGCFAGHCVKAMVETGKAEGRNHYQVKKLTRKSTVPSNTRLSGFFSSSFVPGLTRIVTSSETLISPFKSSAWTGRLTARIRASKITCPGPWRVFCVAWQNA